ncbi:MAG: nuclear transport factor 2 family protein [Sandaracinaceae bacterium]|nr:nuclear transport factor 2 family protein [Sandaracinaceae bacterium]
MSTPSETEATTVVETFLAKMEALDLDGALALLADDIVYQNYPLPADRGIDAVSKTLRGFGKVMTAFRVEMHNIAERDGVVLTERTDILIGPLLYLDIRVNGTFEVRDGKIVLWRDYFDVGESVLKLLAGPVRRLIHRA